jgi:hypothetical protein
MSASLSCKAGKLAGRVNRRADAIGDGAEGAVANESGQNHQNSGDRKENALRREMPLKETDGDNGEAEDDAQNPMPGWDIRLIEHGASFFAERLKG